MVNPRSTYTYDERAHGGHTAIHVPIEDMIDELRAPSPEEDEEPSWAESQKATFQELVRPYLEWLPPMEADIVELRFFQRKKQAEIGQIFGMTQAAISYRIERAVERLRFFLSVPHLTEEGIRTDLRPIFSKLDVDILALMWRTTCQSVVAKTLGETQGLVRHRLVRAIQTLAQAADEDEAYRPYADYFAALMDRGLNTRHAVELPQWIERQKQAMSVAPTDACTRTIIGEK